MKPEIAKALSDQLDRQNQEKQKAEVQASEREKQIAQNVSDFEVKKNAVIKPAFEEIIDLYREKGFVIRVVEQAEVGTHNLGTQPASVGIDMLSVYPGHRDMKPGFTLSFDKRRRELSLRTSTGTQSSPAGSITLDSITDEWIHSEFAKFQGIDTGKQP